MILFSVAQVAKLFDVHEATVLGWLRDGLPAFKKGRVILAAAALAAFWLFRRMNHDAFEPLPNFPEDWEG